MARCLGAIGCKFAALPANYGIASTKRFPCASGGFFAEAQSQKLRHSMRQEFERNNWKVL